MGRFLNPFQKISTATPLVDQVVEKIQVSFDSIFNKEILDGRLIADIALASGSTNHVEHGLQRAVVGYIVVKKSANSTIWDSESSNTRRSLFLDLNCSSAVTVTLWVF